MRLSAMNPVQSLLSRINLRRNSAAYTQSAFDKLCASTQKQKEKWPLPFIQGLIKLSNEHKDIEIQVLDVKTQNYTGYQTNIIGFDESRAEILLDTPSPLNLHSLVSSRDAQSTVLLRLLINNDMYQLRGELSDLTPDHNQQILVTFQVESITQSNDKRLYPRAQFTHRKTRPTALVEAPGKPAFHCKLVDISRHGARLIFEGRDIRSDLLERTINTDHNHTLTVEFAFNDHFKLPLACTLIQAKYLRTPGCHNQLRVKFVQPTATDQYQIDEFIELLTGDQQTAA